MSEIFIEIPAIKYGGPRSKNKYSFKYYNPDEVLFGKLMRDQLKFSIAF